MLDSLLDRNHRHGTPFFSKNLQESFSRVKGEWGKDAKCTVNIVITIIFFESPVTINSQKKYANVKNERQISSEIHA